MTKPSEIFPECQPVLEVVDVPSAVDWYVEKLGFECEFVVGDPPSYACLGRSFTDNGAPACLRLTAWCRDRTTPVSSGWLAIYVGETIDALYKEYQGRGVAFSMPLENHGYGMREFEIRDCAGNFMRFGCMIDQAQSN